MQKGITPFVILDEDAEAIKKDKLMRKRAKRTIDENLWDSVWLSKLYPSRYYDFYEKWELGNDQFDPALFPDRLWKKIVVIISPLIMFFLIF